MTPPISELTWDSHEPRPQHIIRWKTGLRPQLSRRELYGRVGTRAWVPRAVASTWRGITEESGRVTEKDSCLHPAVPGAHSPGLLSVPLGSVTGNPNLPTQARASYSSHLSPSFFLHRLDCSLAPAAPRILVTTKRDAAWEGPMAAALSRGPSSSQALLTVDHLLLRERGSPTMERSSSKDAMYIVQYGQENFPTALLVRETFLLEHREAAGPGRQSLLPVKRLCRTRGLPVLPGRWHAPDRRWCTSGASGEPRRGAEAVGAVGSRRDCFLVPAATCAVWGWFHPPWWLKNGDYELTYV